MRRLLFLLALLALPVAACGTDEPPAPTAPSPSVTETKDPFPDVTKDGDAVALLLSFEPQNRAAIIEPALFLPGIDYCKALQLDPIDRRCAQEYVIDGSKTKVTFPLAKDVKLLGVGTGEPECIGDMTEGAKCSVSRGYMSDLADSRSPVHVTIRDGKLTKIAELYRP
ncbi:hypothetical protein COUCH_05680 [Couchioplanes caeruleus]|uniref:hypothetical protein n=1 Tax=Couchioplanes caeruleus TaxID=56438 RepID=UPI0020BE0EB6|nr:hypothetical protein [Couchioplanes caeruleus]UQU65805.1 hypothetical protein COUCH_05680 [Couchioplanes caeruleus]